MGSSNRTATPNTLKDVDQRMVYDGDRQRSLGANRPLDSVEHIGQRMISGDAWQLDEVPNAMIETAIRIGAKFANEKPSHTGIKNDLPTEQPSRLFSAQNLLAIEG
jgi:hypothetical protein